MASGRTRAIRDIGDLPPTERQIRDYCGDDTDLSGHRIANPATAFKFTNGCRGRQLTYTFEATEESALVNFLLSERIFRYRTALIYREGKKCPLRGAVEMRDNQICVVHGDKVFFRAVAALLAV